MSFGESKICRDYTTCMPPSKGPESLQLCDCDSLTYDAGSGWFIAYHNTSLHLFALARIVHVVKTTSVILQCTSYLNKAASRNVNNTKYRSLLHKASYTYIILLRIVENSTTLQSMITCTTLNNVLLPYMDCQPHALTIETTPLSYLQSLHCAFTMNSRFALKKTEWGYLKISKNGVQNSTRYQSLA